MEKFTAEEIIQYISNAEKETPLKIYINGSFDGVEFDESFKVFGTETSKTVFADARDWQKFYPSIEDKVTDIVV